MVDDLLECENLPGQLGCQGIATLTPEEAARTGTPYSSRTLI